MRNSRNCGPAPARIGRGGSAAPPRRPATSIPSTARRSSRTPRPSRPRPSATAPARCACPSRRGCSHTRRAPAASTAPPDSATRGTPPRQPPRRRRSRQSPGDRCGHVGAGRARRRSGGRHRRWRCHRRSGVAASNTCIDPPRPRLHPSCLPYISAIQPAGTDAPRQRMSMLAIRGHDRVIAGERSHAAYGHSLLADIEVQKAADLSGAVQLRRTSPRSAGSAASRADTQCPDPDRNARADTCRSSHGLQRRSIAFRQAELTGPEQAAQIFPIASRGSEDANSISFGATTAPRRERAKPSNSRRSASSGRTPDFRSTNALTVSPRDGIGLADHARLGHRRDAPSARSRLRMDRSGVPTT